MKDMEKNFFKFMNSSPVFLGFRGGCGRYLKNGCCKPFSRSPCSKCDDNSHRKRLNVAIQPEGRILSLQREFGQQWKCPNSCGSEFQQCYTLRWHLMYARAGVDHASETSSPNTDTPQRHTNTSSPLISLPNFTPITIHIQSETSTQNTEHDHNASALQGFPSALRRDEDGLNPSVKCSSQA